MKQSLLALTIWNAKTNTKRKEVDMKTTTNYKGLNSLTKKELIETVKICDQQMNYWKKQYLKLKGIK